MAEQAYDKRLDADVEAAIESSVSAEVKKSVIDIYDDLLGTIWSRILPTLGSVTCTTIMQRAVARTAAHYPVVDHLKVSEAGVSFAEIKARLTSEDKDKLTNAFKELIANLFDILAKLTGNILVQQLIREVEGLEV